MWLVNGEMEQISCVPMQHCWHLCFSPDLSSVTKLLSPQKLVIVVEKKIFKLRLAVIRISTPPTASEGSYRENRFSVYTVNQVVAEKATPFSSSDPGGRRPSIASRKGQHFIHYISTVNRVLKLPNTSNFQAVPLKMSATAPGYLTQSLGCSSVFYLC